jgi:hypothetical protein
VDQEDERRAGGQGRPWQGGSVIDRSLVSFSGI